MKNKIRYYVDASGRNFFNEWWRSMRDTKAKGAILRRIDRMRNGNFGDCKPLRDGVFELRIDIGPGYRVYYAKAGLTIVLLLSGGDKRTQKTDIEKACKYWQDWQKRNEQEENRERQTV